MNLDVLTVRFSDWYLAFEESRFQDSDISVCSCAFFATGYLYGAAVMAITLSFIIPFAVVQAHRKSEKRRRDRQEHQ